MQTVISMYNRKDSLLRLLNVNVAKLFVLSAVKQSIPIEAVGSLKKISLTGKRKIIANFVQNVASLASSTMDAIK